MERFFKICLALRETQAAKIITFARGYKKKKKLKKLFYSFKFI